LSSWSSHTLIQDIQSGGLKAQRYDLQLAAFNSKWIFQLLDPSNTAPWKALSLINLRLSGFEKSLFLLDKSVLTVKQIGPRWLAYLSSWFSSGILISPPPLDFECLMNKPLWFNRVIRKPNGNTFGHALTYHRLTFQQNISSTADLVVSKTYDPSKLHFMRREELRLKYGASTVKLLTELIDCIPYEWRPTIFHKMREAFQVGEWICKRMHANNSPPPHVYKVLECFPGYLKVAEYILQNSNCRLKSSTGSITIIPEIFAVKVCMLDKKFYGGNYLNSSALLSRISWLSHSGTFSFQQFSIGRCHTAFRDCFPASSLSPYESWNNKFNVTLPWPEIFKYVHDPLLTNRTKQFLFKLISRACMVGSRIIKFRNSPDCIHCSAFEDETHVFISCPFIQPVWSWLWNTLRVIYPSIPFSSFPLWSINYLATVI
jgi:hypothetical protein